jgi:hypothetical protein
MMDYYLAIKKNEIMLFAGIWMELEIIKRQVKLRKTNTTFLLI